MYTTLLSRNYSTNTVSSNGFNQSIFSPTCDFNSSGEIFPKNQKDFQSTFTKQRKIPIKIILNDDEEVISQENNSETTEENSLHNFYPGCVSSINSKEFKELKDSKNETNQSFHNNAHGHFSRKVVYIFNILKSRKKEKKYLRKKYNKIITRVHNMDCLLKKIKA